MTLDVEAEAIAPWPLLLGFIHELPRRGLLENSGLPMLRASRKFAAPLLLASFCCVSQEV
jgi:hypothetical protein